MTALAASGQLKQLAERQTREMYWRSLNALARRGKVPNVPLSHLAVRVLLFLLGQRPGYFAHHKVIADAVESNLTSVRKALFELRAAGFVSWNLIPPQHPLPTGKYTRTNVNQYFVEAEALLRALGGDEAVGSPRTVASTHPNSSASTGTDPKFEQDPPLPPSGRSDPPPDGHSGEGEIQFSKFHGARPALGQPHNAAVVRRADQGHSRMVPPELEKVLAAWRTLDLGEPDDRSIRALRNRHAEGATSEQLAAAVEGARHNEWLRQGRAKSPFAVVFASLASVERFASSGREHARKTEATARERAAERRAARVRFDDVAALSPAESAELAALALSALGYPAPPIRTNSSPVQTTNFSPPSQFAPPLSPVRTRYLAPTAQGKYKWGGSGELSMLVRRGLLLGAGFSYDLGMPLAAEVSDLFFGMFNPRNTKKLGAVLSKNEPYGPARPISPEAIRSGLDHLLKYKSQGARNYEEYLAQLEAMPWKVQPEKDSYHYLFSIFYGILYDILITYQRHSYEVLYELNKQWFSKFSNLLNEDETWVFSLNHDAYIECLAIDLGIPVTYGDTGQLSFPINNLNLGRQIALSSCTREDLTKQASGWYRGSKGINLVRLHGGFSELEYKDGSILCNPKLNRSTSAELISEVWAIESMAYFANGQRVPSGKDRVITGPDGTLDIMGRAVLTGGNKYSKTTNVKKGEEKLSLFDHTLKEIDELTVVGYSFGDLHVNYRLSNAMVLNEKLAIRIVDPSGKRVPEFLQQFDYNNRMRRAYCGAAQWMTYSAEEKWDESQVKALKENERFRREIRERVSANLPR